MTQQSLDFARGEQLAMLRDAVLPRTPGRDGRGVSPAALKSVLRAVDDYGRGREAWPTLDKLHESTALSARQVRRAVEALESLSLLIVERRRYGRGTAESGNHYRIVWNELALRCSRATTPDQVATVSDQVATTPDQVATVSDQVATVSDQVATVSDQVATVSDQVATGGHLRSCAQQALSEAPKETSASQGQDYSADFAEWWKSYPRHESKRHALTAWQKAVGRLAARFAGDQQAAGAWLLEVTQEFAATPKGQAGLYTPYPATFLNGERYDDDPATWHYQRSAAGAAPAGPGQRFDPSKPCTPL